MGLYELISNAIYNRRLYEEGKAKKNEVRLTTIGWRPDPINKEDGYVRAPDGEYYRVIRSDNKKKRR
jgi:hypothetical protein